jgi:hypothetical protein
MIGWKGYYVVFSVCIVRLDNARFPLEMEIPTFGTYNQNSFEVYGNRDNRKVGVITLELASDRTS